jgi:tetratricopeptide (TPR) repeat protein
MSFLSASQLNNYGVLLQEMGCYCRAESCFIKATNVLRDTVLREQLDDIIDCQQTPAMINFPEPASTTQEEGDEALERESIPLPALVDSPSSPAPRRSLSDFRTGDSHPSKRQRTTPRSTLPVSSGVPLGHAIWMKSSTNGNDPISVSATILYNLGLLFHRTGQRLQALQMYEMAKTLVLKCTAAHSPILFVCLHNLKELYLEMDNEAMYAKMSDDLVKLLRIFTNSYEVSYLRLLSVHNNGRDFAAAA